MRHAEPVVINIASCWPHRSPSSTTHPKTTGWPPTNRPSDSRTMATPRTPDFWWGNFVLAPGASALDAAVALHAEMFPEADFVSVGIDGTDGALGIDAAAAGRGLTVERSTALSSTAVCLPPRPNTDAEVRRLHSDEDSRRPRTCSTRTT